jgi:hypothetical protein
VILRIYLDGYKKLINELRQRGLMKVGEGKKHIKLSGYFLLTNKFMRVSAHDRPPVAGNWSKIIFTWSYWVL